MRQKLIELEKLLLEKVKNAQQAAERTKKEAHTLGHAAAGSWSVGAERNFAEGQAAIAADNLEKIETLLKEIRTSLKRQVSRVEPVCFLETVYEDGRKLNFYLVKHPVHLKEVTLVSSNSALGRHLSGKGVGDKAKFSNSVLTIEKIG